MGCTGSIAKNDTNFGYMQKETLYYKIKDKNKSVKPPKEEPPKETPKQMINESFSSDNSESDSSQRSQEEQELPHETNTEQMNNVLYKHKPTRPSKLKELKQSGSKYDKSDRKYDKENELIHS